MNRYQITTSGPRLAIEADSLTAAAEYVQRRLPMKRGWTSRSWSIPEQPDVMFVQTHNSKGRMTNSVRVALIHAGVTVHEV